MSSNTVSQKGFFLHLHPMLRIGLSIVFAAFVFFLVRNTGGGRLFHLISTWGAFALSYVIISWIVIISREINGIKKIAAKEDGSRLFVLLFTIITSFAAFVAVALLVINSDKNAGNTAMKIIVSFLTVFISWILVHTILTFHYAHLFYGDDEKNRTKSNRGLDFPGDEEPDYRDFAYFSFVIGMTFQVSDVQITGRVMRRVVLLHGLIAFLLNTFVVALSVNIIAGLSK